MFANLATLIKIGRKICNHIESFKNRCMLVSPIPTDPIGAKIAQSYKKNNVCISYLTHKNTFVLTNYKNSFRK